MDIAPITPAQYPEVSPGNLRVAGYWTDGACMFRAEKAPWKPLPEGNAGVVAEGINKEWALAFLDAIEEDQGGERSHNGFQLMICGGELIKTAEPQAKQEPETPALF